MLTGGRVGVSQDEPFSKHASLPAKIVFSFIVLLILISIGTVYVDSMPGIDETTKMVVEVLELVCSVVFLIEVAIRFVCMESLVICISDPFMWIDVRLLSLSKIPAGVGGWWWLGERHVTKGEDAQMHSNGRADGIFVTTAGAGGPSLCLGVHNLPGRRISIGPRFSSPRACSTANLAVPCTPP